MNQAAADAYVDLIRRESTVLKDPDVEEPDPDDRALRPGDPHDRFLVELARAAPAHALVSETPGCSSCAEQ